MLANARLLRQHDGPSTSFAARRRPLRQALRRRLSSDRARTVTDSREELHDAPVVQDFVHVADEGRLGEVGRVLVVEGAARVVRRVLHDGFRSGRTVARNKRGVDGYEDRARAGVVAIKISMPASLLYRDEGSGSALDENCARGGRTRPVLADSCARRTRSQLRVRERVRQMKRTELDEGEMVNDRVDHVCCRVAAREGLSVDEQDRLGKDALVPCEPPMVSEELQRDGVSSK